MIALEFLLFGEATITTRLPGWVCRRACRFTERKWLLVPALPEQLRCQQAPVQGSASAFNEGSDMTRAVLARLSSNWFEK